MCLSRILFLLVAAFAVAPNALAGPVRFEGEGHAQNPVFSLDGRHLAFEVNRFSGDIEMFVSEVNGDIAQDAHKVVLPGGSTVFGTDDQVVGNPAWHPQGFVIFEGSSQGGFLRIYYHQPGGSAPAELISNREIPENLMFPAVSPNGQSLAFIAQATGKGDVRTRDSGTGAFGQVTSTPQSEMFPQYLPDGDRLLYSRKVDNSEDAFVIGNDGSGDTLVAGGAGDQTRPTSGAEGQIVFFDGTRGTDLWDIAVVDAPGGSKRIVAKSVRLPIRARPAVSPDGKWVAYTPDDPAKQDAIVLARLDGSTSVTIETDHKACGEPAFSRQGARVLLAYTALPASGSDWRLLQVVDVTGKL